MKITLYRWAAGLVAILLSTFALAQQFSATAVTMKIDAQPLDAALNAWASQTGYSVLVPFERAAQGKMAPKVQGKYTPEESLKQLLMNTGLKYELVNEKTVRVAKVEEASNKSPRGMTRVTENPAPGTESSGQKNFNKQTNDDDLSSSVRDEDKITEIVVTAQKRAERLQDVPISISVLQGADLDRSSAEGISELLNRVPGAASTVGVQGGGTQITLRGVTAAQPLFQGSSPIAYYLDSVPFGLVKTAIAPDSNAYDLNQVEVLRGPQGTLYGASAQNGVVRVLTHDADLSQFELKGRTSISSTQEGAENYRGDVAVNVPLIEGKLGARAVVGYQDQSGWIDRPNKENANDAKIKNFRLKLNAQPTESLSIGASAWLARADYGAPSTSNSQEQHGSTGDESITTDYDLFGLKIGYEFAHFSLSSMSGYLTYTNDSGLDLVPGGTPLILTTAFDAKVFSQEFVLNSTHEGRWKWSAGAMYRDGEDRLAQPFVFLDHTDSSESFAIFGELTRRFLDGQLELTGGLRYFEDDVTGKENSSYTGVPGTPLISTDKTFDALSPRLVLSWHPSAQWTLYGSYAEGFRSGFNQYANIQAALPGLGSIDADTLSNYELGAKGSALDGVVSFDAAVYFIDWKDVQQGRTIDFNGVPFSVNVNGDSASGMGVDLGLALRLSEGFQIGGTASWNDLKMDSTVSSGGVVLFEKGDRLNFSPEHTLGAFADYSRTLGGSGLLGRLSLSANYTSEREQRSIVGGVQRVGTGDDILIARASFAIESLERWTASLFADNLTDERGATSALYSPFPPEWDSRLRPRTVGVQLEVRF